MIQKMTTNKRTVVADTSDEMDEIIDFYKERGWHVIGTSRQADGSYRSELVKDES